MGPLGIRQETSPGARDGPGAPLTWHRVAIWGACLLVILAAGVAPHGFFETSSISVFDAYQRFSPQNRLSPQIIVVAIDDESLRRLGQWPWRRDQLARLLDATSGASVVGLDILLSERDRLSPAALLANGANLSQSVRNILKTLPDPDAILDRSIANRPVILAAAATNRPVEGGSPSVTTIPVLESGSDPRSGLPRYGAVETPLPEFVAASKGVGIVSTQPEPDGVTRRIPAIVAVGQTLMPSFAIEVLCLATDTHWIRLNTDVAGNRTLRIGTRVVEIDSAGRAWPSLQNHRAPESLSAYRVVDGEIPASRFRNRIVLIGAGATGLGDLVLTPLHDSEPAIVFQAQFIDSVMSGDTLWRPPTAKAAEVLLALVLATAALTLLGHMPDRIYGFLFAITALVMVLGSYVAFRADNLLVDWTFPLSAVVAAVLVAFILRVGDEVQARHQHERELMVALRKAAAADRAKTEFLANTSHELRTPLNVILGFSEIMSKEMLGPLPYRYTEYARDIHRTATGLLVMISDILDLVVLDLGGIEPMETWVDVMALITDSIYMIRDCGGTGDVIQITADCPTTLPPLRADARMFKKMVTNLLSNAMKYSPRGSDVSIHAAVGDDGGLSVAIRDRGAGMATEDIAFAMKPFGRLRPSQFAQAPGIGTGLPLTKSMIEMHGGTLTLQSDVGIGTEAVLWFPPDRVANSRSGS